MTAIRCVLATLLCAACGREESPAPPPVAPSAATATPATAPAKFEVTLVAPAEVEESSSVTISASAPGDKPSFHWTQVAGPPAVLATPYAAETTFKAPEAIADYELRFEVEVQRGSDVVKKPVAVHVRADDDPPTAEVYGPAGVVECGERIVVTGQGRTLEPQRLRFDWHQIGDGVKVQVDHGGGSQASFVGPDVAGPYHVWLELSVSDGVNPPALASVKIEIECDGRARALAAGATRKLEDEPDVPSPLPRGNWRVDGSLTLEQSQADQAAVATLRFEYDASNAAAFSFSKNGANARLRMFGLVRDRPEDPWREPQSSGAHDLGEWPADQPLGFEFAWDGRELAIHWGPPGLRDKWPEPPFPLSFPLASRPRAFAVGVVGGQVALDKPLLTGL